MSDRLQAMMGTGAAATVTHRSTTDSFGRLHRNAVSSLPCTTACTVASRCRSTTNPSLVDCLREVWMRPRSQVVLGVPPAARLSIRLHSRSVVPWDWISRLPKACASKSKRVTVGTTGPSAFCFAASSRSSRRRSLSSSFFRFSSALAAFFASLSAEAAPVGAAAAPFSTGTAAGGAAAGARMAAGGAAAAGVGACSAGGSDVASRKAHTPAQRELICCTVQSSCASEGCGHDGPAWAPRDSSLSAIQARGSAGRSSASSLSIAFRLCCTACCSRYRSSSPSVGSAIDPTPRRGAERLRQK
eukprot:scaffold5241_cov129-Isochrysis_galbana.AAC.1